MGRNKILYSIAVLILLCVGGYWFIAPHTSNTPPKSYEKVTTQTVTRESISYRGVTGKDALSLMKQQTRIEQNSSGLVTSINGRKVDDKKHEFWAFYVNGKMATVGPAQYVTKSTDTIEWKIETY